jgi:glucokinase
MSNLFGIDIGGTKCAVIFGKSKDNKIEILDREFFLTKTQKGPGYALNSIAETISDMLQKYDLSERDIKSIGISCGGPLDSKSGVILSPPNLPGWDNIEIVNILEKKFGIKTIIQNDANACALVEWKFGAGQGYKNIIFLTFGTGIGAGLILDGRLYSGTNDMAGEVGHIRLNNFGPVGYGKSGSFEGFCSGGGITQLARAKVLEKLQKCEAVSFCSGMDGLDGLNAKIVGDAAEAGDPLAKEIYEICGRQLGRGLAILIDILNPQLIIIGNIFTRSRDLLWPFAQEVINREALSCASNVCSVVPSSLGEKIGDYASLAVALSDLY